PLFDGRTIIPTGNTNYSLLGITQKQCTDLKVVGDCAPFDQKTGVGVPSVDKQLDKCSVLLGSARLACYEQLDKYMTLNVVPWVPWMYSKVTRITSENVTKSVFDQSFTPPAYSSMAVNS